jgi:DNA-binding response OmpR family regulator/HPt (histidine-containing phosphotransfer) domain-containing protein
MRILLVEDDECLAKTIEIMLVNQHYVVDVADDGEAGWELAQVSVYDLILLDVMLPKLDGISFCQRLRSHDYQIPVLLITAKNSSQDKVIGLDAGADDYIVKPFEFPELLARVRVLLRRLSSPILPVIEWENLRLDPGTCEVTYNSHILRLTPKEYRLLELFLRNRHCVLSRSAILDHLWSFDEAPSEDTVTAHIKGLRHKLKQAGAPSDFIETVYGLGYRLKLATPPTSPEVCSLPPKPEKEAVIYKQTRMALASVWERMKGQSSDRLTVLEQAIAALRSDSLSLELRYEAQQAAHKLVGALGVFGFSEGSRLAREVEQVLQPGLDLGQPDAIRLTQLLSSIRQELQKTVSKEPIKSDPNSGSNLDSPRILSQIPTKTILVVDNDAEFAGKLVVEALEWDINIEMAPSLAIARAAIARQVPDVVVLDLAIADTATGATDSFSFLEELVNHPSAPPVIVLTTCDRLSNRVQAARLGVRAFLRKPLMPEQVLLAVTRTLNQVQSTIAKVMLVDDDPKILAAMRVLLEPCGIRLTTLAQPHQFWKILEEFTPDLLILDVEMPHYSGIDLCQTIRNAPRWSRIPILFLSAHHDVNTMHQAFMAGANDYISKTLADKQLTTRVLKSLEYAR